MGCEGRTEGLWGVLEDNLSRGRETPVGCSNVERETMFEIHMMVTRQFLFLPGILGTSLRSRSLKFKYGRLCPSHVKY